MWIEKYKERILSGELTLEDVRKIREKEVGKKIKVKTVNRLWNKLGYTLSLEKIQKEEPKDVVTVCSDCLDYMGYCNTQKQTFKGWLNNLDRGFCPFKRM